MLTHGWRRFNWPKVWNSDVEEKKFNFSKGLIISGTAEKLFGKPLKNKMLRVVAKSDNNLSIFSTPVSEKGHFEISDFHSEGVTELIFNAFNASDNQVDVKITLDENTITVVPPITEFSSPLFNVTDKMDEYITYSSVRTKMDSIYGLTNVTKLDEVVVSAQKIEKEFESPTITDFEPDITVYAKDKRPLVDIFSILRGLPGVHLRGAGYNTRVRLRNNLDPPLWIVNNTTVSISGAATSAVASNPSSSSGNTGTQNISGLNQTGLSSVSSEIGGSVPDFVQLIDVNSIEKIEVHKGATAASISGLRGKGGAIIIYTQLYPRGKKLNSPRFDVLGHAIKKEFYSPKYDIKQDIHATPDYRATLYWNPSVSTDENGKATIEFFNSDTAKQIQLSIEGMSSNGKLGTYLATFGEM
jgi:protein involved in ribonucleotide reduction